VIVVSPRRRAFCTSCGARWIQEGSEQRSVKPGFPEKASAGPGLAGLP
jgi:hypothetical protein